MKQVLKNVRPDDFEEFGYQTRLACTDTECAIQICRLHLYAREEELQPEISRLNSDISTTRHRSTALHAHLYDRPIPVSDAAMLTHLLESRILLALTLLVSVACLVGNTATFVLLGYELPVSLVGAIGLTALPLVVGHLAYEKVVAGRRGLQIVLIAGLTILCFGALLKLGAARRDMVDRAAATAATASYVDGPASASPEPEPRSQGSAESKIQHTIGDAMLWFMIAADIALGFFVGLFVQKHTDEDYAAWRKLKSLSHRAIEVGKRVAEFNASIEIAKRLCMAGILRAQNALQKRRPPYHQALTMLLVFVLFAVRSSWGQKIEHYEGILIDTSRSISRDGAGNQLFHRYLDATKKLLLTEPPNSHVWVFTISTDSFGGADEVLRGWTPDSRGVFTGNLDYARRELASRFETKSAKMSPAAAGTDIFGGLWRLKTLIESNSRPDAANSATIEVWIFSDMMNETKNFPMPTLIDQGSPEMLDRARANGLIVPLNGYRVHVDGASTTGLTPKAWSTVKDFWINYFASVGAKLVSYNADISVGR